MDKSELPEDITQLTELAEAGDAEAQVELGNRYYKGLGVEQNHSVAFDWCRKAAEQGHPRGQNALGVMYKHGNGVEKNYGEALTWYNKAIDQEYAPAMSNMGLMYQFGRGVEQSYSEASFWFRKAAELKDVSGLCNLAELYREGLGVKQNDIEAIALYSEAAEQDDPRALCNLGWMYRNGRGVEKSNRKALELYRRSADKNHSQAQYNLGWLYKNGIGVKQNYHEAISWYNKAVEQNHASAQFNLGLMYMYGQGTDKNYVQAIELFRKASKTKDPELRFKAIEFQDQAERHDLSPKITEIRKKILSKLKVDVKKTKAMTHYTSLPTGSALLLEKSPLRLGHINALNDPNEGKLLWHYLGHTPIEGKPAFVGCYLPEDDSLNMWRFYSKNTLKDDACGCAITFNTDGFFNFNLLPELSLDVNKDEEENAFINTGKSPQESAAFYRIVYVSGNINIHGDDKDPLEKLFFELKSAVKSFLGEKPDNQKFLDLSRLLGPLPYLLKDADYEAEKEHRIIVTHLEYGAKEIQSEKPILENGTPPRLYLELHRINHLAPVKHVTLGPKAPNKEMMIPYWHHKLKSDFYEQLKNKPDFYIKASKCAYQ